MTHELGDTNKSAAEGATAVKRRKLLRFGTLLTAITGASAISTISASAAQAGPGDKNPSTSYVPTAEKGAPSGVATLGLDSRIPAGQLPNLSATILDQSGSTKIPAASVVTQGVKADYDGRVGRVGTGTDDRAAIQAALNAASDLNDFSYYGYLTRRSVTVKLPAGFYLISSPGDGTASLKVPAGVTFDTSDATLFFDMPSIPTTSWCGIQVGQYASLIVGKVINSGRVSAPDTNEVYDGVRLVGTDNNSRVLGYKDSEIRGWQGACIRGIGAWISHIQGIRFTNARYGYIASTWGSGYNLAYPSGAPVTTNRVHTEISFYACQFVNLNKYGFVGSVTGAGAPSAINDPDFSRSGISAHFASCSFENMSGYAINAANVFNLSIRDCHLEEVGTGDGMVRLSTARVVEVSNLQINQAGREVPAFGGTGTNLPNPSSVFKIGSGVLSLDIQGVYCHNSLRTGLLLLSAAPTSFRVAGVVTDDRLFGIGAGVSSHQAATHFQGTFTNPIVIGSTRLWADASGALRQKAAAAPVSDTDGSLL